MEGSAISDEMREAQRKWHGEPHTWEVHRDNIFMYAKAVGDNNPLWMDEDYAKSTRWGGIIAPPTFLSFFNPFSVLADDDSQDYLSYLGGPMPVKGPFKRSFSAGDEYEIFRPVRPGDFITTTSVIGDIYEKQGKPDVGRMVFVRYDTKARNQRNELVAIIRWTSVTLEGPTEEQSEKR